MNPKYIGKTIALPKDAANAVEAARQRIHTTLGVKLSLSQTVAYLAKFYHARCRELDAALSENQE